MNTNALELANVEAVTEAEELRELTPIELALVGGGFELGCNV